MLFKQSGNEGRANVLTRRYVGPPGRQLHFIENCKTDRGVPLICLHATAYSSRSFESVLAALEPRRRAIAIDTPGYGCSDRPSARISLEEYAARIGEAVDELGEDPVDLLGYHTGALIAGELARQRPSIVRRLVLIGVPCFSGAEQREWKERLAAPTRLAERLDQFQERWNYLVTDRATEVDLAEAYLHFVDELRAYPHGWWAHDAAFSFDAFASLSEVEQQTLVLNPDNALSGASRRAAAILARATLVELPHLSHAVLDLAADEIAERCDRFLSAA